MKKLVSAVTIAALTAGAMSAEVKIGLNSRTRPSLYTMVDYYESDNADPTADYSIFGDFSYTSHKDTLSFETKSDYAGAKLVMSAGNVGTTYSNSEDNVSSSSEYSWSFDGDAYAWLGWGNFKLYGGKKSHRGKVNRVNAFGLLDDNIAKYGLSTNVVYNGTKKMSGTFLKDFNDFGTVAGTRYTTIFGEYALKDVLPGDLIFAAGMFANNYNYDDDYQLGLAYSKGGDHIGAGFNFMASYSQKDLVQVDLVVKKPHEHQLGLGIYGEFDGVENLVLAGGFTWGQQSSYDYYKTTTTYTFDEEDGITTTTTSATKATELAEWSAFAVDFRAKYKVMDPLTLAFVAKFSSFSLTEEKADKEYKDGTLVKTGDDLGTETALDLGLGAKYVFSETLEGNITMTLAMSDLDNNDGGALASNTISVQPDVTIYAGKNAYFEAGVLFTTAIDGGDAEDYCTKNSTTLQKTKLAIPLVLRVKI